ncbi:CPBP family intramembrane glutamic endopeptidase [Chloroherpeton thalassium]|nr:CPBP family intramembrane glutamic endopeptidase [Chloroherpeton thalassium]
MPTSLFERVIQFPLIRMAIALSLIFVSITAVEIIFSFLIEASKMHKESLQVLDVLTCVVVAHFAYVAFVKFVEHRKVNELAAGYFLSEVGQGIGVGTLLMSSSIFILWLLDVYQVHGLHSFDALVASSHFRTTVFAGYIEELLFRAIVFRISEEKLGTWIALALQAILFGFLHAANPGASWFSSLAISLEAGLLLGAAYVLTRRLWLAIGIHAAWNYTQGAIFGIAVSGYNVPGLLDAELTGNKWLSGGAFGAETSLVTLLVCTTAGFIMIFSAMLQNQLLPPFWRETANIQISNEPKELA